MDEVKDAEPAAPFQSPLADRLYRRASGPLGVIDVSVPRDRYQRATAWTERHLMAIDRALSRFTPDDSEQQAAADYSVAARYLSASSPAGGQPMSSWSSEGSRATTVPAVYGAPVPAGRAGERAGGELSKAAAHVAKLEPALRVAPVARSRAQVISRSPRPPS